MKPALARAGIDARDLVTCAAGLHVGHHGPMESKGAAEPQRAASAERDALADRERAADERSRLADARERRADEREAVANQRERKADERETLADTRDREADAREAAATERDRQAEEREQAREEHGRALGAAVEGLQQRMLDTIERSRALLALSEHRLNRQEAELRRAQAHRERQQAEISRASAETERKLADWLPDPSSLTVRRRNLGKQARLAIQAFVSNEEQTARLYQDLAARHPERREEYLGQAEHARTSARSARDALGRFTG